MHVIPAEHPQIQIKSMMPAASLQDNLDSILHSTHIPFSLLNATLCFLANISPNHNIPEDTLIITLSFVLTCSSLSSFSRAGV
jgi:hypothetical protein